MYLSKLLLSGNTNSVIEHGIETKHLIPKAMNAAQGQANLNLYISENCVAMLWLGKRQRSSALVDKIQIVYCVALFLEIKER